MLPPQCLILPVSEEKSVKQEEKGLQLNAFSVNTEHNKVHIFGKSAFLRGSRLKQIIKVSHLFIALISTRWCIELFIPQHTNIYTLTKDTHKYKVNVNILKPI